MAASGQIIRYENVRTLDFGSISGTYSGVGGSFQNPIRIIKIKNGTDADLYISFNGIDDMDALIAHSGDIVDYGANRSNPVEILDQSLGERVYVRSVSGNPTTGNVYVTAIYASTI